jgi:uncharacterized protein YprB with RNaseH-like and TPR domain
MDAPFGKAVARLAETIDRSREYTVVENDNIFRSSFIDRHLFSSEYHRAGAYLEQLIDEYLDASVVETVGGTPLSGACGDIWVVRSTETASVGEAAPQAALGRLHRDLRLVHGIGPALEGRLRRRGYYSIGDLVWHRRLAPAARTALETLRSNDPKQIAQYCAERRGRSHPDVFLAFELYHNEEHVYLDLETLGLFSRPIVLFGLARVREDRIEIEQYLVRDLAEERDCLASAIDAVGRGGLLVSFNGRSFDVPYLHERAAYYGLPFRLAGDHLDLLPLARRQWRDHLPDCRLNTLEQGVLGYNREEDLPSAMVPEFYSAYLRTGSPGPLLPILSHNRKDLVSMVRLVARLREICHAE